MDLDVRHLRLVVAIAEQRSLTRASEVLHLTQSALSHQLRDIEDRLGTPLFLRLNKRMALTPAGERLLEHGRAVLDELSSVEGPFAAGSRTPCVPLRLSTECYTCYHWLPAVLKPFQRALPERRYLDRRRLHAPPAVGAARRSARAGDHELHGPRRRAWPSTRSSRTRWSP